MAAARRGSLAVAAARRQLTLGPPVAASRVQLGAAARGAGTIKQRSRSGLRLWLPWPRPEVLSEECFSLLSAASCTSLQRCAPLHAVDLRISR